MKYQKNYLEFMKKMHFVDKKAISFLVLFILVVILFLKTNFLKNLINILKFTEEERIEKIYGFCGGESIGYLKYLKKKYKIKTNPKILNFTHTPPTKWSIYEYEKKNTNENQKIILNYPGKEVNIELLHYKENLYELINYYYYSNLFEYLKNIKIEKFNEPNVNIEFYIKNESDKLVMLKNLQASKNDVTDDYILNQKLSDFKINENKFYLKLINVEKKTKISLILKNKYNLDNYKILDKFKNCYFVE